jgi:hypothetical protein
MNKMQKELNLKSLPAILFTISLLAVLSGCKGPASQRQQPDKESLLPDRQKVLLAVDFQKGRTLEYKLISEREIDVDWNPRGEPSTDKSTLSKSTESMEMVIAYIPVKVDPYGLTTIEATCKQAKVTRTKSRGRDALETLRGKTFTFTVDPVGKIQDYSDLERVVKETGNKAFRSGKERIKDPDMVEDFIAIQWFLWDSASSIEKFTEGVSIGQSWDSQLPAPTTMVLKRARNVTYTLDEIRPSENGRLAVIKSSFSLAESVKRNWPIPYSGSFRLSGRLGFLRQFSMGLEFRDLQGQGEDLFDIDTGQLKQLNHRYEMNLQTSIPLPGAKPLITIKQNFRVQLLQSEENNVEMPRW